MAAPSNPSDRPRAVQVPDGPLLIEGPVDLVLADDTPVNSDRFLVAICTCRRSKRYPLCDTSHRRRVRGHVTDPPASTSM